MSAVTISEAKNRLSELLVKVRAGEELTILDRKLPIARIEAIRELSSSPHLRAPRVAWEPEKILALPIGEMSDGSPGLTDAVAEERDSGW